MSPATVTVITPVYNGGPYLRDCIESVLAQTCTDFRYVIADNCSTDDSLQIAREYAENDPRISVIEASDHVDVIRNWNRSLEVAGELGKYVKFVYADDWLFPTCIERMVGIAEQNDNVALVSSYRLEEVRVSLDKLPTDAPLVPGEPCFTMSGPAVGRAILRERASVLGSPSSVLMRTSAMDSLASFYDTAYLHSDKDAALGLLSKYDFGFVREVLVFTRRHNESLSSRNKLRDTHRMENIRLLKQYGPEFLDQQEFQATWKRDLADYYRFLAGNVGCGQDAGFWDAHRENLAAVGERFSRASLIRAFIRRWLDPARAVNDLRRRRALVRAQGS